MFDTALYSYSVSFARTVGCEGTEGLFCSKVKGGSASSGIWAMFVHPLSVAMSVATTLILLCAGMARVI